MVYLLKFGAGWVLPPGIFIVMLSALAFYLWRVRGEKLAAKWLAVITLLFYLACLSLVSERAMGALEDSYAPPAEANGDVIIMLGGGAIADVPDVDGTGELCGSPANRLLTVIRLQRELNVPILLSGGQVFADSGAEAKIARRVLLSLGVPDDMIFTEENSINTTQNARFSAEILRSQGFSAPILVTSAFHMRRSVLNFAKQGIEVTPYPADYQTGKNHVFHYTKLKPDSGALWANVTVLQECLRYVVTKYIER